MVFIGLGKFLLLIITFGIFVLQSSATSQNEVYEKFFPKCTNDFNIQLIKAEILRVIGRVIPI